MGSTSAVTKAITAGAGLVGLVATTQYRQVVNLTVRGVNITGRRKRRDGVGLVAPFIAGSYPQCQAARAQHGGPHLCACKLEGTHREPCTLTTG